MACRVVDVSRSSWPPAGKGGLNSSRLASAASGDGGERAGPGGAGGNGGEDPSIDGGQGGAGGHGGQGGKGGLNSSRLASAASGDGGERAGPGGAGGNGGDSGGGDGRGSPIRPPASKCQSAAWGRGRTRRRGPANFLNRWPTIGRRGAIASSGGGDGRGSPIRPPASKCQSAAWGRGRTRRRGPPAEKAGPAARRITPGRCRPPRQVRRRAQLDPAWSRPGRAFPDNRQRIRGRDRRRRRGRRPAGSHPDGVVRLGKFEGAPSSTQHE